MKSAALPSFWIAYKRLDKNTKERAKKAFLLWAENPFHPYLRLRTLIRRKGHGQFGLHAAFGL